jgi:Na+/H+ antiporter NhaD/arsenite permease-like protein
MQSPVVAIFCAVYVGMILGGWPLLQLDRTGVALLGAIAVVGVGALSPQQAAESIHLPTILLLFSFMVVAAQLRLGGFYDWVTLHVASAALAPPALLAGVVAVVGLLSAVFSNDIVCLAVAPLLAATCLRRGLDPVPYLLGLACSANVGSAATLIGNPQNMLIGQTLGIPFAAYLRQAAAPATLGLVAVWLVIVVQFRGRWTASVDAGGASRPGIDLLDGAPFDLWQSAKGLAVAASLLVVFLFLPWPREVAALVGAGVLLLSRRLHSRRMLGLVDWGLLVLFIGLFVVNAAFERTGLPARALAQTAAAGLSLAAPAPLFGAAFALSNIVSNVPAVMLLLPAVRGPGAPAFAGPMLALVSTFAGNLLIVGSIANIIVVDAARRRGIDIGWRAHARVGIPVTLLTLGITAAWFAAHA